MDRDEATLASRVERLQQTALFGGLRDDTVRFLLEQAHVVDVRAGELFVRENEPGDAVYLLEAGSAVVVKGEGGDAPVLRRLHPGDCFGEMSLIDFSPRSASVRAIDDAQAIAISAADLHRLYERDVEQFAILEMNMGREVSRRLRESDAAMVAGGHR